MIDALTRAQRWHDTDHGHDRKGPLRNSRFRSARIDAIRWPATPCWCCCPYCNPATNPARRSPFWYQARQEIIRRRAPS